MDIRMPSMDGIEATRRIANHGPRVLMLRTFDLDDYVFEAFKAGASGFLVKDAPRERIIDAIRAVAAGEALASPPSRGDSSSASSMLPGLPPNLPRSSTSSHPANAKYLN